MEQIVETFNQAWLYPAIVKLLPLTFFGMIAIAAVSQMLSPKQ